MGYDFRTLFMAIAAGFLFVVGVPACSSTLGRVNKCTHALDAKAKSADYHCNPQRLMLDKENF